MNLQTAQKLIKMTSDLYESQASDFSNTRSETWERPVLDFVDKIPPRSSILDLGCGNGRLFSLFREKLGFNGFTNGLKRMNKSYSRIRENLGITYLGIDTSKKLIALNHKKYNIRSHQFLNPFISASFKVGDGLKIKYRNRFDYVICLAVLHHMPSKELQLKFLKNIHQALKPKGQALISVWNRWQPKYQFNNLTIQQSNNVLDSINSQDLDKYDTIVPWRNSGKFRYIHTFTATELKELAQKTGFKNIDCFYADLSGKSNKNKGLNIYLIGKK